MANHINLDDPAIYTRYDPADMLARIKELPWQCRHAWDSTMRFELPAGYAGIEKVVILGMGGSAIGGDLVKTLVQSESPVPVIIHRDYGLPAFVDEKTLVIGSSYSGNTEETLSGFEPALGTGARVLAMTTGGRMAEMAAAHNIPVYRIEYEAPPRAALGFSFLPTLGVLQKLGLIKDKSADVAEAIDVLEKLNEEIGETSPEAANPAKQLARRLYGNLPVVYGAGVLAEVAHRWKTQINENGKAWAFYEVFPELNHNATVGFPFPPEVIARLRVIMLRAPSYNDRIKLRCEVTAELLDRAGVAHENIESRGRSLLAQMLSVVLLGDIASYYLAILNGIDPSPVEVIDYLKGRLAKG